MKLADVPVELQWGEEDIAEVEGFLAELDRPNSEGTPNPRVEIGISERYRRSDRVGDTQNRGVEGIGRSEDIKHDIDV